MVGAMSPSWVSYGKTLIGTREIPGPKTNAAIALWLHALHAWWTDDETPWCGVYVAHVMQACGYPLPKNWMRAKAWADWGTDSPGPLFGSIGVKDRVGGGHVFICVGQTGKWIHALGGNQGNRVSIAPIDIAEITAFRWPAQALLGTPLFKSPKLPFTAIGVGGSEA